MIDFAKLTTTREECMAIARIASRAETMGLNGDRSRIDLIMDLEATHHVCPLDLDGLHNAEHVDFAHDLSGIVRHLDRQTGELRDAFCPRFAL